MDRKKWLRTKMGGFTFIEIMGAILVLTVAVLGAAAYRYFATLDARKADVQITAARFASMLLDSWRGRGGYSGYSKYDLIEGSDAIDPNDYDPDYDYDIYNPDDYDYDIINDANSVEFCPGLTIYDDAPGPAVPAGFSELDSASNPNYRIVVDGVNYYATLSYKDEVGKPRVLNVCIAWMDDYQTWSDSEPYRSVSLTTYADD